MDLTQFLPEKFKKIPCHMPETPISARGPKDVIWERDYEGQKRAEQLFQVIIVLFGVVGFIWGYICQQFSQTMYILLAGFALSCILTLPPWPMFRRKPLQWQKGRPEPAEDSGKDSSSSSSQSSQKSKKKK